MQVLTNHIGYSLHGDKYAVIVSDSDRLTGTPVALIALPPLKGTGTFSTADKTASSSGDRHFNDAAEDAKKSTGTDTFVGGTDTVSLDNVVAQFELHHGTQLNNWQMGTAYTLDFSAFAHRGRYQLVLLTDTPLYSHPFEIRANCLFHATFSDLLHYFKSQRCSGIYEHADQRAKVFGSDERVDVSGGWYDASGDVSKYLSHLSYANYFNPQQIPLLAWGLADLTSQFNSDTLPAFVRTRLADEAKHGADFLLRMQHPSGFFYMTVFDQWSKDPERRTLCAYATQDGVMSEAYQAGFRQGGGMAIAALSAASRAPLCAEPDQQTRYLDAAIRGYWHLVEHNRYYLDDGEPNIIDETCALLAACELHHATRQSTEEQSTGDSHAYLMGQAPLGSGDRHISANGDCPFLSEARGWMQKLVARQRSDETCQYYWSANADGSRPFYHAADAGLPGLALVRYLDVETDPSHQAIAQTALERACQFELNLTQTADNPFAYPRQYVKPVDGVKQVRHFIPHHNETGYWWQGENARLGSLATFACHATRHIHDDTLNTALQTFSQRALNWILGLNPFDICMLDGHGHNNPDYLPYLGFFNAKGGICNGITSGMEDETQIAFNPAPYCDDMAQNWRWGEQWLPHASWFMLAISAQTLTGNGHSNKENA
ncbi:glycoside hydrolase family 9 protein [Salinivibrio kushneri]|uniref:glycoside hydrolase family 9 protein n=1 Tax=Salinivibrio kushneri TaxID=1908198 RepID=UPI0022B5C990|nr:glycoside hydrolase family 9 protein [Salinivibrio kushneri]WBA17075.1 glycoside hydrolase family 9 protein [Salinivibrio kushneri]